MDVLHSGSCHCGAVAFEFSAPKKICVSECNCSICTKKQLRRMIIVNEERFKIIKGKDILTEYTFNTHKAKHLFCKICGVTAFYKPRSNPEGVSINYYCVDSGTIENIEIRTFNGQNWEESIKTNRPNAI